VPAYLLKVYKFLNTLNRKIKEKVFNFLFKEICFYPLFSSIIINSLIFLLLFLFTTPVYRSNDDIILNLISSGFFGNGNTEFVLFGNIILGKLLKLCYDISSQYNWYLLFLIFIQFLSHVIILYYLLKASNKYFTLFIYLSLFSIFSVNLFSKINFSGTSLIALSVSLFIIYSILNKKSAIVLDYIFSLFLFAISILIRKDTFYIFCFIFSLFPILYSKRRKEVLVIFTISVICFISIYSFNGSYYKKEDPLQIEYRKANRIMLDGIIKPSISELTVHGWD
jgi:hypothetical protein